ncbi:hypothetical protein N2152v2_004770 [Parachlorella kessleri]
MRCYAGPAPTATDSILPAAPIDDLLNPQVTNNASTPPAAPAAPSITLPIPAAEVLAVPAGKTPSIAGAPAPPVPGGPPLAAAVASPPTTNLSSPNATAAAAAAPRTTPSPTAAIAPGPAPETLAAQLLAQVAAPSPTPEAALAAAATPLAETPAPPPPPPSPPMELFRATFPVTLPAPQPPAPPSPPAVTSGPSAESGTASPAPPVSPTLAPPASPTPTPTPAPASPVSPAPSPAPAPARPTSPAPAPAPPVSPTPAPAPAPRGAPSPASPASPAGQAPAQGACTDNPPSSMYCCVQIHGWGQCDDVWLTEGGWLYVGLGVSTCAIAGGSLSLALRTEHPGLFNFLYAIFGFPMALTIIVFTGTDLFTSSCMYSFIGVVERKFGLYGALRMLAIPYFANLVGALLLVGLQDGAQTFHGKLAQSFLISVAHKKCTLGWGIVLVRGILANFLVCLAVWLAASARDFTGKFVGIFLPISSFVALGYAEFIRNNLMPATIGNIIGGMTLVGGVYCLVYGRPGAAMNAAWDGMVQQLAQQLRGRAGGVAGRNPRLAA